MSQEITVDVRLNCVNVNLSFERKAFSQKITQASVGESSNVQTIGFAADELLVIAADLTTPRWTWFRNLDDTHFVSIGEYSSSTFHSFCKLKPGEAFCMPLDPTKVYHAQADTAAVKLEHCELSD